MDRIHHSSAQESKSYYKNIIILNNTRNQGIELAPNERPCDYRAPNTFTQKTGRLSQRCGFLNLKMLYQDNSNRHSLVSGDSCDELHKDLQSESVHDSGLPSESALDAR